MAVSFVACNTSFTFGGNWAQAWLIELMALQGAFHGAILRGISIAAFPAIHE